MPDKIDEMTETITAVLGEEVDDATAAALEGLFGYFNAMEKLMSALLKAGPEILKDSGIRLAILEAMVERMKLTVAMKGVQEQEGRDEARWSPEKIEDAADRLSKVRDRLDELSEGNES